MLAPCNSIESAETLDLSAVDVTGSDDEKIIEVLRSPSELGTLQHGNNKHFYSNGAFNLIQLVLYILSQTGPAHVFMCSYSISMDSIATLLRHKERGNILDIRFLIDNRVRSISPKPFDYLITAFPNDYRCCALHAKVALIWNKDWKISVIGSQNATHNPKLERGIIHTDSSVFSFDLITLRDAFDSGTK